MAEHSARAWPQILHYLVPRTLLSRLHRPRLGLGQGDIAHGLNLGGEGKLLFLRLFFLGHEVLLGYTESMPPVTQGG